MPIAEGGSLEDMAGRLIMAANEQGGNDNVSVVLLRSHSSGHP